MLADVLDGLVSERAARETYGVALAGGAVDAGGTARLRAAPLSSA